MSEIILLNARREHRSRFIWRLAQALACMWLWHQRVRQRAQLANLDDRLLHDIGVSRDDAERECTKPFWR